MPEIRWVVALWENGEWNNSWDGTLHVDKVVANEELNKARVVGYLVELSKVTISNTQGEGE